MRKIISLLLIATCVLTMTGCSAGTKRYQTQILELFDTDTTIIGYAKDKDTFTQYTKLIRDTLYDYHQLYDIYNDYQGINNLKTINDNAGKAPVKVDQKIIEVLKLGQEAYRLSGGEVNIAFGAVLSVWHKYREEGINDPENAKLPPMDVLKEKSQHTDINKMVINEEAHTVFLEDPEMSLDVGAIAKGYATERTAELLEKKGITGILLSVGGNVRVIGSRNEKEKLWSVGVQNPDLESEQKYMAITQIQDLSLVSSGDYERYYTVDGQKYCHIIDPQTLMPATYFKQLTILTKDSGLADALSTTLFTMPLKDGMNLIKSLDGVEAMWIAKDGTITYSSGFESFIKK